jgi:type I restriction enzyme, S subunit
LGFEKYRKSLIPKGATCVVTIGSIGKKMTQAFCDCFINQAVNAVIPNKDFDNDFVFYLLKNNLDKVKGLDSGTSSGRENVSKSAFSSIEVKVIKHLPTQRKIASILSAYDDLIENNLKRIKLLEEKAFVCYKTTVKNEKVEEKRLNHVTQFLKRGISPNYVDEDGVIVLNQKCIRNHLVSFEESRLTDSERSIPEERMLKKFDTLINSTGTGTLGRIAMNIQDEFPLTVDSHITIVRANSEVTPIFLCISLFAMENIIEMMGEGATNQTELSPRKVGEEIKIPIVPRSLMNEFEKETEHIFNLICNLQKQNTKLREARDILLPRLMSGEIEV